MESARLLFYEREKSLRPENGAGSFPLSRRAGRVDDPVDAFFLQALEKGKPFTAEQLTLGIMVHIDKLPAEIMPAWCHWLCEFKPLWDENNRRWVEPFLPHEELGILHLSGFDQMRIDRTETTDYQTLSGKTVQMSYRYPHFNGETGQEEELSDAAA